MHDIARIQRPSIGVPDPDVTGAMPGEVDDFQLQTADVENVTVLDGMIDFSGSSICSRPQGRKGRSFRPGAD
jgi:hypothetical protein